VSNVYGRPDDFRGVRGVRYGEGALTMGWTTGTATGGGVPSRDHIPVGGQYKLYI